MKTYAWLPIKEQVNFRYLCLIHHVLNSGQPVYLLDLLKPHVPTRNLRSADRKLLEIPFSNTDSGNLAFSRAAPRLWNSLPLALREECRFAVFRVRLHELLMNAAYG